MNFLTYNLTISFITSQLIFHYFHISAFKKLINYSTKKYLMGYYFNYSYINLFINIILIKNILNVLTTVLLKNGKILFCSEYYKDTLYNTKKILFKFLRIFFCFRKWIPGTLMLLKKKSKFVKKNFYLPYMPDLILSLPMYNFLSNRTILKEATKFRIPVCVSIDSSFNLFLFTYFCFINLKSFKSSFFYLNIIIKTFIKLFFFKKSLFGLKLVKLIFKK